MNKVGMNMERIKYQNRSLILNYINDNGPVSRKDIAQATGLTAASVTQISALLISEGILREMGPSMEQTTGAGRKKVLLDIIPETAYVYAVNIEPDETTVAICNIKGKPARSKDREPLVRHLKTDRSISPEAFLEQIAEEYRSFTENCTRELKKKLVAVSVGITGIVDVENGISLHAYGIWDDPVDIRKILQQKLDLQVIVENNVDAFAIAELLFGIGRKRDNILMIKWGPGVGSTIIIDDRVYKGRRGKTAELGHAIMVKDGKRCSCGRRGCLETLVSYKALNEIISFDPMGLEDAYLAAPLSAKKQIDELIDLFARSIVNAGTIVAPQQIVLFGKLFRGEEIRSKLIASCKAYDSTYNEKRIIYTRLSESEGYIGPAAVFAHKYLFSPQSV